MIQDDRYFFRFVIGVNKKFGNGAAMSEIDGEQQAILKQHGNRSYKCLTIKSD